MATFDEVKINYIIRWAKNGRKYVWEHPTQKKLNNLVKKYGVDQICDDVLWLQW